MRDAAQIIFCPLYGCIVSAKKNNTHGQTSGTCFRLDYLLPCLMLEYPLAIFIIVLSAIPPILHAILRKFQAFD